MGHVIPVLIAVLSMAFGPTSFAKTPKGDLDGKKFAGRLTDVQTSAGTSFKLIFENGTIQRSKEVAARFGPILYASSKDGAVTRFVASVTNEKGGRMEWQGTVKGNQVEATLVRASPVGVQQVFKYKGELEK